MTIYMLKNRHQTYFPNSHFFDYDTLKFFGECLSTMRVLKDTVKIKDYAGKVHECYCVSSLQRKAPGGPKRYYSYFDTTSYEQIME